MEDKKSSKHNVDPKKVWENVKAKEDLTFTSKDLTSRPHKNFFYCGNFRKIKKKNNTYLEYG